MKPKEDQDMPTRSDPGGKQEAIPTDSAKPSKSSPDQQSQRQPGSQGKPVMQSEPKPPFPPQHQTAPGIEEKLDPKPRYQAPKYKAAGKLEGKVALITGG